jgi:hypothetical protein
MTATKEAPERWFQPDVPGWEMRKGFREYLVWVRHAKLSAHGNVQIAQAIVQLQQWLAFYLIGSRVFPLDLKP